MSTTPDVITCIILVTSFVTLLLAALAVASLVGECMERRRFRRVVAERRREAASLIATFPDPRSY